MTPEKEELLLHTVKNNSRMLRMLLWLKTTPEEFQSQFDPENAREAISLAQMYETRLEKTGVNLGPGNTH